MGPRVSGKNRRRDDGLSSPVEACVAGALAEDVVGQPIAPVAVARDGTGLRRESVPQLKSGMTSKGNRFRHHRWRLRSRSGTDAREAKARTACAVIAPATEQGVERDLTGAPVVIFLPASTGKVDIVYRRRDVTNGRIVPPVVPPASVQLGS